MMMVVNSTGKGIKTILVIGMERSFKWMLMVGYYYLTNTKITRITAQL